MNQNSINQNYNYEEVQKKLAPLIWKNDNLREKIVNSPKQAIEKELNIKFDENIKISVVNHADINEITFILPVNPSKVMNNELSDDLLQQVSGGHGISMASNGRFSGSKAFGGVLSSHQGEYD